MLLKRKNIVIFLLLLATCIFALFGAKTLSRASADDGQANVTVVELYDLTGEKLREDTVVKNLLGRQAYGKGMAFRARVLLNDIQAFTVLGILQSEINVYSQDGYYLAFNAEKIQILTGSYANQTAHCVAEADVSYIDWQTEQGVIVEFGAYDGYTGVEKTHVGGGRTKLSPLQKPHSVRLALKGNDQNRRRLFSVSGKGVEFQGLMKEQFPRGKTDLFPVGGT